MLIVHVNCVIQGSSALVYEKGEETPLKAGDIALVNPDEKHHYRNKGDKPFKMICGVPRAFELGSLSTFNFRLIGQVTKESE